jgi:hypothetical protein
METGMCDKLTLIEEDVFLPKSEQCEVQTPPESSVVETVDSASEKDSHDPFEFPPRGGDNSRRDAMPLNEQMTSATDTIPGMKTDRWIVENLGEFCCAAEVDKSVRCLKRGYNWLWQQRTPRRAYSYLKMGMLGTGESAYSKLLTGYFKECLNDFCASERIEDSVDKLTSYIDKIRKVMIFPDYYSLRIALSDLIQRETWAGNFPAAIRFQKEAIFFTMLEGTNSDFYTNHPRGDYNLPLEKRISNGIQNLHSLMRAQRESNNK